MLCRPIFATFWDQYFLCTPALLSDADDNAKCKFEHTIKKRKKKQKKPSDPHRHFCKIRWFWQQSRFAELDLVACMQIGETFDVFLPIKKKNYQTRQNVLMPWTFFYRKSSCGPQILRLSQSPFSLRRIDKCVIVFKFK